MITPSDATQNRQRRRERSARSSFGLRILTEQPSLRDGSDIKRRDILNLCTKYLHLLNPDGIF